MLAVALSGCGGRKPTPPAIDSTSATGGEATGTSVETSQTKLARGQQRLSEGDFDAASKLASEVLVSEPDNAQAMVLAARAAMGRGELDMAVEMFDAASECWPEQSAALYAQATGILWQQNRLSEVQDRFGNLLDKYPRFDEARRGLATVLNRRGFRFDANQQIRILCRRPSVQVTVDELRCLMVPSRSFHPFATKPSTENRDWIQSMGELNVARALYGEGDVRDALAVLEASDVLAEKHPAAVALHGQMLLESQQFKTFEQWLVGVEPSCRPYPAYWMALGGWALRQQQPEQAARMFGEAILREPSDVAAHDRMLQALEAIGDREAIKRFEKRSIDVRSAVKMTRLILDNPEINPAAYRELADRLDLVGRPFEAKSWRSLADLKSGLGGEATRRADVKLRELLDAEDVKQTRNALLCDVDISRFKLDLDSLQPSGSGRATDASTSPGKEPGEQIVAASQPVFVNVAQQVGIDFRYVNADPPKERYFLMHEAVGSGVACLDYDHDGRVDLYVGQGACNAPEGRGTLPNLLARNLGGEFSVVTAAADCDDRGYTLGVTAGDWNQDGFADLVVGNMTENRLLINQGDGTFKPHTAHDPLWQGGKYTSSVAIADVTGDHLPDIVEVTYLDDPDIFKPLELNEQGRPERFPGPLHFRACLDRVFVGLGDGTMRGEVLRSESPSPGLGLLVTDIDGRGGNEIFVANDMKANHLWLRNDKGFVDAAVVRGVAYGPSGAPLACMGIAAADFDENGLLDLHITNFTDQWTNQYMQNADNMFDDLTLPFGLDKSTLKMLGFGTEAFDFDNNTSVDLVTGNGHIDDLSHEGTPFEMPTQFFVGDRQQLTLTPVAGDPEYWDGEHLSRGLVTLDWNNDGLVDIVTTDLKEPLALLENRTDSDNHWIQLSLVGRTCERDAIGAVVTIHFDDGRSTTHQIQTGDGYMSKNEPLVFAGLGAATQVSKLEIRWPDGTSQVVEGLAANLRWLLVQHDLPYQW